MRTAIYIVVSALSAVLFWGCGCDKSPVRIVKVESIPVATVDSAASAGMHALIAPYKAQMEAQMGVVIGQCESTLDVYNCDSPLGNLIADIIYGYAAQHDSVDFALINVGGIRRSLYAGDITVGDIYAVSPFDNSLVVLTLKGADVSTLVDEIAKRGGEGVSGLGFDILDGRAYNVKVAGAAVDSEKIYRVATIDYLSWGNDEMYSLAKHITQEPLDIKLREAILEYVKGKTANGEMIASKSDGRIT